MLSTCRYSSNPGPHVQKWLMHNAQPSNVTTQVACTRQLSVAPTKSLVQPCKHTKLHRGCQPAARQMLAVPLTATLLRHLRRTDKQGTLREELAHVF